LGLVFLCLVKTGCPGAHRLAVLVVGSAIVWPMYKNAAMAAVGRLWAGKPAGWTPRGKGWATRAENVAALAA